MKWRRCITSDARRLLGIVNTRKETKENKMTTRKCRTCDYYDGTRFFTEGENPEQVNINMGVCRFSAPRPGRNPWANVSKNDWCRNHNDSEHNQKMISEQLRQRPAGEVSPSIRMKRKAEERERKQNEDKQHE